jgi:hypothetical protein
MEAEPEPISPDDRLSLHYEGGLADNGTLLLPEYAASLDGWRDLFQVLGELYFHSFPELGRIRGTSLLRIEVVAERRGSYVTILNFILVAAASGVIGPRANATVAWSFRKLAEWYRGAVSTYLRTKSQNTDFTAIAKALESMSAEAGIPLEPEVAESFQQPLFDESDSEELGQQSAPPDDASVDRASVLTERLDQALKRATQPLENSCERVKLLVARTEVLLEIGPAERSVIAAPLTAPPPKRDWIVAKIKFERINRKTGKALFYFENENDTHAAHYCHIVDLGVSEPHNRYTQAFNDDELLEVWVRQTHPEKGRLNLQWEVIAKNPGEGMLFSMPPLS